MMMIDSGLLFWVTLYIMSIKNSSVSRPRCSWTSNNRQKPKTCLFV